MKIFTIIGLLSLTAQASSYTDLAQNFINQLIEFNTLSKQETKEAKAQADQLLKKTSQMIDIDQLALRSLGKNRSKVNDVQLKKFKGLLMELIEQSAYPKAKKISAKASQIKYTTGTQSDEVKITGKIEREKFGEIIENDFELVFYFNKTNKIFDAIIEGELLSSNLERQISKALEKKTFDNIINSMEEKLKSLKGKK